MSAKIPGDAEQIAPHTWKKVNPDGSVTFYHKWERHILTWTDSVDAKQFDSAAFIAAHFKAN